MSEANLEDSNHSAVTSSDVKMLLGANGEVKPAATSDFNANPEGIATVHQRRYQKMPDWLQEKRTDFLNEWDEDVLMDALEAYTHPFGHESNVVVAQLPDVVDPEKDEGWLETDRKYLEQVLRHLGNVEVVGTVAGGNDLVAGDRLEYRNGYHEEIEGVVNFVDMDQAGDQSFLHLVQNDPNVAENIVNSPFGIWNQELRETGKIGLMKVAGDLESDYSVYLPDFTEVATTKEAGEVLHEAESSMMLKVDPFGTHGNSVIHLDYNSFNSSRRREVDRSNAVEFVEEEVNDQESYLRRSNSTLDNFRLTYVDERPSPVDVNNEEGRFCTRTGEPTHALIEEAIEGTFTVNNQNYEVLEVREQRGRRSEISYPVDFVPLVTYDGDQPRVNSVTVRISDNRDLNANLEAESFDMYTLEEFVFGGPTFDRDKTGLEMVNELTEYDWNDDELYRELYDAAEEAGRFAWDVRNTSARRAAENLETMEEGQLFQ